MSELGPRAPVIWACVNKVEAQKTVRPLFLALGSLFDDVLSEWLGAWWTQPLPACHMSTCLGRRRGAVLSSRGSCLCQCRVCNSSTHLRSPLTRSSHASNSNRKGKLWFTGFGENKCCWDLVAFKANSALQASLPDDSSFPHLPPTPNSFCPLSTWIAKCHEQRLFFSRLSMMSPAAIYLLSNLAVGKWLLKRWSAVPRVKPSSFGAEEGWCLWWLHCLKQVTHLNSYQGVVTLQRDSRVELISCWFSGQIYAPSSRLQCCHSTWAPDGGKSMHIE